MQVSNDDCETDSQTTVLYLSTVQRPPIPIFGPTLGTPTEPTGPTEPAGPTLPIDGPTLPTGGTLPGGSTEPGIATDDGIPERKYTD